jgi:beta-fructofuranosidase
MPSVPEFLLRQLYVKDSLKRRPDGFEFQLNNTLTAVSVTSISITADGHPIPTLKLFLKFPDKPESPAAFISELYPIELRLNTPLTVRAIHTGSLPRQLAIEAETNEVGRLRFSINSKPKKQFNWVGPVNILRNATRQAALARRVARDPYHPIYHFTPPANWMNDPNSLIHWQGQTHLFYQYNPNGPLWGTIHWGHAITSDLVQWKRLPIALAPHRGKPGADGCWSGTAVITPDGPLFFYTAVFPETVCLALPDDGLRKLYPSAKNPLIKAPPPDLAVEGFRDPCVWQEGRDWFMTIGSGIKGQGGAILLYSSKDLVHWEYRHPLLVGDLDKKKPFPTGFMWECPQMINLGEKDLLILSAKIAPGEQYAIGYVGHFKDEQFIPEKSIRLDHGGRDFYAPLTFEDDKGRRVMFAWLPEEREDAALEKAGWAGALSLPRILSLSTDGELLMEPAPELEHLKNRELFAYSGLLSKKPLLISGGSPIRNVCFKAALKPQKSGSVIFCLASSPDASERTLITVDFRKKLLQVDTTHSSLDPLAKGAVKKCPLPKGDSLEIQVFLDGSILEFFANQRIALTTRLYPTKMEDLHLYGYASGSAAQMIDFQMWEMSGCI